MYLIYFVFYYSFPEYIMTTHARFFFLFCDHRCEIKLITYISLIQFKIKEKYLMSLFQVIIIDHMLRSGNKKVIFLNIIVHPHGRRSFHSWAASDDDLMLCCFFIRLNINLSVLKIFYANRVDDCLFEGVIDYSYLACQSRSCIDLIYTSQIHIHTLKDKKNTCRQTKRSVQGEVNEEIRDNNTSVRYHTFDKLNHHEKGGTLNK